MPKPPRLAPLSLRLTPEDRARLERDAMGMSLGAYIRWRLFDPDTPPPRHRGKAPVKDHQALSAVLAQLAASRISSNLNQLAKAANSGSLILTPEVMTAFDEAMESVAFIRRALIDALGMSEDAR